MRNAKSLTTLQYVGDGLQAMLPQDMDSIFSKLIKNRPKGDEPEPEGTPGQRSDTGTPDVTGSVRAYQRSDRTDMKQLIDATKR